MKKFLMISLVLTGLIFPLACGNNNSSPTTGPLSGGGGGGSSSAPTNTPIPGTTYTFTHTPIPGAGTPTASPTPTFALPTPIYYNNYGTSAAPNGMSYDPVYGFINVAEAEVKGNGDDTMIEQWAIMGSNALALTGVGNTVEIGVPTPGLNPAWQGATVVCLGPQGVAYSGEVSEGPCIGLLDVAPNGSASIYTGQYGWLGQYSVYGSYEAFNTGFGGFQFNNPKGFAADGLGDFYVADTGNAWVDEFGCGEAPPSPAWLHRWNGSAMAGVSVFKQPTALACDAKGDVYVGDAGYNPSIIQEFSSGGTTIINPIITTIANCIVRGIAVDANGNVFVADAGNNLVEEYSGGKVPLEPYGSQLRNFTLPHSMHEFDTFVPDSVLVLTGQNIYVGDSGNDLINVFGP